MKAPTPELIKQHLSIFAEKGWHLGNILAGLDSITFQDILDYIEELEKKVNV